MPGKITLKWQSKKKESFGQVGGLRIVGVFYGSGQKILVENLATVPKPRCPTDRLRIAKTKLTKVNLG
jgi:hypothetical protein